jgi:hypothetical protein
MSRVVKIGLCEKLSVWLAEAARQSGSSEAQVVIRTLEKAMAIDQGWLRLAGRIKGPRDLSSRRGFETGK